MRTIVHLSDLHFGCVDPALLDPLVDVVAAAKPDVVAISDTDDQPVADGDCLRVRLSRVHRVHPVGDDDHLE